MRYKIIIITLTIIILITLLLQLVIYSENKIEEAEKFIELNISGGLASMQINILYYKNNTMLYNNIKINVNKTINISDKIMKELSNRVSELIKAYPNGLYLPPNPHSADYFTYILKFYQNKKEIIFSWTDTSNIPTALNYLKQLLLKTMNLITTNETIIFYLKLEKLEIKENETIKIFTIAINPAQNNFSYTSPTPCSPDFKLFIKTPRNETIEIFPLNYVEKPCIQIIQQRTLKAGKIIQSEYQYTFATKGNYTIKALFPYAEWNQIRYLDELIIEVTN